MIYFFRHGFKIFSSTCCSRKRNAGATILVYKYCAKNKYYTLFKIITCIFFYYTITNTYILNQQQWHGNGRWAHVSCPRFEPVHTWVPYRAWREAPAVPTLVFSLGGIPFPKHKLYVKRCVTYILCILHLYIMERPFF